MLTTIKKNITLSAFSQIDGKNVAGYSASINSENPEDMNLSDWIVEKATYKANRKECRADQAEFEDMAYQIQDEMLQTNTTETE